MHKAFIMESDFPDSVISLRQGFEVYITSSFSAGFRFKSSRVQGYNARKNGTLVTSCFFGIDINNKRHSLSL